MKRRYHLATEEGDEAAAAVGDPASLMSCWTEDGEAAAGGEACLKISRKEMDFLKFPRRNEISSCGRVNIGCVSIISLYRSLLLVYYFDSAF